jgi:acetyl-CoA synthetase
MNHVNALSSRIDAPDYEPVYQDLCERGSPGFERTNAAVQCCDRHAGDAVALKWADQRGGTVGYTFSQLQQLSCKFANLLVKCGVRAGDPVAVLLPRSPELVIALLAVLRMGATYQPLFTAFGPKAVDQRIRGSGAKVVITDSANRSKIDDIEGIDDVICVGPGGHSDIRFDALEDEPATFPSAAYPPDWPMFVLFTSGTTGTPKGVLVPYKAMAVFEVYMRYAIDLQPHDKFWNIADPGWAYGLYYGLMGPLLLGNSVTFLSGAFTVESCCRVIDGLAINNLAGAPTAFRMLMARGDEVAGAIAGKLRVVSSAGEALNPEVVAWFEKELACPIRDHYGQTEGGIILANHHGLRHPLIIGSAGRALPGLHVLVLDEQDVQVPMGDVGELCVDRLRSPLFWFDGYWDALEGNPPPPGRYHRTGDLVRMQADGTVTFVGRSDDVITSAGYRIGPFDVESTLMEHQTVAETAVIGKPDAERTEVVKAFVVLKQGISKDAALGAELQAFVRARLSAHAYPREIEFVDELPKTPSGKIQRFVLRERERARMESLQG